MAVIVSNNNSAFCFGLIMGNTDLGIGWFLVEGVLILSQVMIRIYFQKFDSTVGDNKLADTIGNKMLLSCNIFSLANI